MTEQLRGGTAKPIETSMLARIGQRLRATYEVWFGPLLPLPPVAPPRACANCGGPTARPKLGRCDACYRYWRQNARERPARLCQR